jgi:hypothetical protein
VHVTLQAAQSAQFPARPQCALHRRGSIRAQSRNALRGRLYCIVRLGFLRKNMNRIRCTEMFVIDMLRFNGLPMKTIGNVGKQETGCLLNNRA